MAEAPTSGRVISNVASAPDALPVDWPERARSSLASSFSLPPSRYSPGMRQSSNTTSPVRDARIPELVLLLPCRQARRVLGDDERRLPAVAQRRIDSRDDHVDIGDAAV